MTKREKLLKRLNLAIEELRGDCELLAELYAYADRLYKERQKANGRREEVPGEAPGEVKAKKKG